MPLLQILPEIFYKDISTGLDFFIDGLGFKLTYNDDRLYIVKRDEITILLSISPEAADGERPQIRIQTDNIEEMYEEVRQRNPAILHPNLNRIKDQPWGLKEFAVLDPTTVCVIFQQPSNLNL